MKLLMLSLLLCSTLQAEIYITVSGANVKRARMALGQVHLLPDGESPDPTLARNIRNQLRSDLEFTALFDFLNESLYANLDQPKDALHFKV